MLRIYITRHGQDDDNADGILNGRRDRLLTKKGIAQARKVASKIKARGISFDAIYSSPLRRAFETAKIISAAAGSSVPISELLLIERDFGTLTGKNVVDIENLCAPDIIKTKEIVYFLNVQGAETFPDLMARARTLLDNIHTRHLSGDVLLVTHGDISKMIYAEYYGLDWRDVLKQFHFGNCDLLLLSSDSSADKSHVF